MKNFPLGGCEGHSAPSVNLGPLISRKLLELESRNFAHIQIGQRTLFGMKFFRQEACRGRSAPCVHLEPLVSRKLLELESRNFAHISTGRSTLFRMKIFPLEACGGAAPLSVNLGPPHISESTRAGKFKFYTHLDAVKQSFHVCQFFRQGVYGVVVPLVYIWDRSQLENCQTRKLKSYIQRGRAYFSEMKSFPAGDVWGCSAP